MIGTEKIDGTTKAPNTDDADKSPQVFEGGDVGGSIFTENEQDQGT